MTKAKKSVILSLFLWGSGQFFICKQRLKGLLFFLIQASVIAIELSTGYWIEWMMGMVSDFQMRLHAGFFTKGIWGIITLGDVRGAKVGDHSMMLMITGIIVCILLGIIGLVYIGNIVDAYKSAQYIDKTNNYKSSKEIIYIFLTIFLYLLKCPQSLILSALRAFCFCGKPHISRSIFLYFRYQAWLKSW